MDDERLKNGSSVLKKEYISLLCDAEFYRIISICLRPWSTPENDQRRFETVCPYDAVFFKLALCGRFGDLTGYPTVILQNLMLVKLQKAVEVYRPILNGHRNMTSRLIFRIVQVHGDDPL